MEQGRTQRLLSFLYLDGNCRLSDFQRLGGSREAMMRRDSIEYVQLMKIELIASYAGFQFDGLDRRCFYHITPLSFFWIFKLQ